MRQKCDSLQLELFKANDFERKSGIELQIKVNQLQQELDLKDQHYSRQVTELKQELQEATLSRDKVTLELAQAQERSKHELQIAREKAELDSQKIKATLERGLLTADDRNKENALTIE